MGSETSTTKNIRIVVDTNGAKGMKELADQMGGLNRQVKSLGSGFSSFRNTFQSAIGFSIAGVGIRTVTDIADSMQNLENRIKVLGGASSDASETMRGLLGVANDTKTSVDGLATIYARLAASTKQAGLSSDSLLQLSKLLQNTFRLSGATTQEATNAAIQLSQGFASGQLRGQELRSVLEQNVVAGDLLAASIEKITGVKGRGGLYKFAEQGKLTTDIVLKALVAGMGDVNKQAEQLGQTFEQTLTVAFNKAKIAINDMNKEFGLSSKFAVAVESLIEKFTLFAAVVGTILVPVILNSLIPAIIAAGEASLVFLATPLGVLVGVLAALGLGVLYLFKNFDDFKRIMSEFADKVKITYYEMRILLSTIDAYLNTGAERDRHEAIIKNSGERIKAIQEESLAARRATIAELKRQDELKLSSEGALAREVSKMKGTGEVLDKRQDLLKKLNKEYESGTISVAEYFDKLEKVDKTEAKRLFKEGKKDLEQYNDALRKFDISSLNRDLNEGVITFDNFNRAVEENKLAVLEEKFRSGKISLSEYDAELVKISSKFESGSALRTGTEDYIKTIGTLSSGIAGAVTKTFTKLEDSLVEFTKTGKFNFNEFAQAILDDLNRIIIRSQVIAPLAKGLLNAFAPGGGDVVSPSYQGGFGTAGFNAKGGAFENGVQKFASGGIVGKATSFGMAGGKSGLMGEAGPEAILPLTRTSSGDLGVQASQAPVFINIINNSGSTVDQKESTGSGGERQIDILINSKVKEGIESGRFDRTFDVAYGLKRKGN